MCESVECFIVVVAAHRAGVTDVTFNLTSGFYSFSLVIVMLKSGKRLVIETITLGTGVTNVALHSTGGFYSFSLNIVVDMNITAVNAVKALQNRICVFVVVVKRPYALKIPTQSGSDPLIGGKVIGRNVGSGVMIDIIRNAIIAVVNPCRMGADLRGVTDGLSYFDRYTGKAAVDCKRRFLIVTDNTCDCLRGTGILYAIKNDSACRIAILDSRSFTVVSANNTTNVTVAQNFCVHITIGNCANTVNNTDQAACGRRFGGGNCGDTGIGNATSFNGCVGSMADQGTCLASVTASNRVCNIGTNDCQVTDRSADRNAEESGKGGVVVCNKQVGNNEVVAIKISAESNGRRVVRSQLSLADGRPFDAAKVDVVHQPEMLTAVSVTVVNAFCKICKLSACVDQVRIFRSTATAAKAAGNGAIPKVSLGGFDVLAAHRAVVILTNVVTDGGKNVIVVLTAHRAGVTDVTFNLAGGFYSFGLIVLMIESIECFIVVVATHHAGVTDVTLILTGGLYSFGLVIVMCENMERFVIVVTAHHARVTDITLVLASGLYSFDLVIVMLKSRNRLLVRTVAFGTGVTNVALCATGSFYSFALHVVMSVRIAAGIAEALQNGICVIVVVVKHPYVLKVPTQRGCEPFLRLEVLLCSSCCTSYRVGLSGQIVATAHFECCSVVSTNESTLGASTRYDSTCKGVIDVNNVTPSKTDKSTGGGIRRNSTCGIAGIDLVCVGSAIPVNNTDQSARSRVSTSARSYFTVCKAVADYGLLGGIELTKHAANCTQARTVFSV